MTNLLENIETPKDLNSLSLDELNGLAAELRQRIIGVTAKNGGHLAPNLGVVELTIALHYVFDAPTDKIVWDVGHQCYAHKLLTGRKDGFDTLRQYGGISGFCSREESEYDCFTTGHSSNSLSLALGMAKARDLRGENYNVIAVIGDGALSGGMAFEALNNAGSMTTPLIVVLNDNNMSINHNVGALHTYLSRLRANPKYSKAKEDVHGFLDHVPGIGKPTARLISRAKKNIKSMLIQGMYFEDLGFTYLGPTDGHDIAKLIDIFRRAAAAGKPVLIHTITNKGKGYAPAEKDPRFWHGVAPFDINSGKPCCCGSTPTFTDVFGTELNNLAAEDEDIIAITAAMTDGTGLDQFSKEHAERFFDVGIAEQHAVSFAAGLANSGKKPVVAIYSSFLQRAYDQMIEDVCLQGLHVVFAIDRAGIVGSDGRTHQGIFDLSYLRSMPGLTVMAPADTDELKAMLRLALQEEGPVAIRYPRSGCETLPQNDAPLKSGCAALLRQGSDLVIAAVGSMVKTALQAAEILQKSGISAAVINARFAAHIDRDTLIENVAKCGGRLVTIEENIISGGFGEGCRECLSSSRYDVLCLGIPDSFVPHGERDQLLQKLGLDAESVAATIKEKWFANNEEK